MSPTVALAATSPMPLVPRAAVLSSCGLPLVHASAVESLYMALKSIDRMDIVSMLEGQPPQPARRGSQDPSRRRQEREHLSPGLTNGEFRLRVAQLQPVSPPAPPGPPLACEGEGRFGLPPCGGAPHRCEDRCSIPHAGGLRTLLVNSAVTASNLTPESEKRDQISQR